MECYILAGGQSRRFGEDKLLFRIGEKRTLDFVIEACREVCTKVFLVTKDVGRFSDLGIPVVEDELPLQTPVVGVYTALKKASSDRVLILSGDMPLMKPEVLHLLSHSYEPPLTLFSIHGKFYPLVALYSRELLGTLENYINAGGMSVMGFVESVPHKVLTEESLKDTDPELSSFLNMNTKEDLKRLMEMMA
ncbi:molybdenum cofactor guanylyltransferase MobA [Hydrogenivirga sp.]